MMVGRKLRPTFMKVSICAMVSSSLLVLPLSPGSSDTSSSSSSSESVQFPPVSVVPAGAGVEVLPWAPALSSAGEAAGAAWAASSGRSGMIRLLVLVRLREA